MTLTHKVNVVLGFELEVEGDVEPGIVGQNLCRLIQTPGQIGNPDWLATPRAVVFIRAEEAKDA